MEYIQLIQNGRFKMIQIQILLYNNDTIKVSLPIVKSFLKYVSEPYYLIREKMMAFGLYQSRNF